MSTHLGTGDHQRGGQLAHRVRLRPVLQVGGGGAAGPHRGGEVGGEVVVFHKLAGDPDDVAQPCGAAVGGGPIHWAELSPHLH